MFRDIKVIGFDADDTLWENEDHFHAIEHKYIAMLAEFSPPETVSRELFATEMANLEIYGFGVKSFTLSMLETALKISQNRIETSRLAEILNLGKELLNQPVVLLPGVKETLENLAQFYRLIVVTKGDLLDQERKLAKSGLTSLFHHIEIMSDKQTGNYRQLLTKQEITAYEFLMVGNSLKSDILPVIELGGKGVYIPYHLTWQHEKTEEQQSADNYLSVTDITKLEEHLCLTK